MGADFSTFDPYAGYNDINIGTFDAGNAKTTYSFDAESIKRYAKDAKAAKETAERIKTHCYPVKEVAGCDIEQQLQKALAESQYWQNKYDIACTEIEVMKEAHKVAQYKQYEGSEFWRKRYERQGEVFTRVEIDLQNRITELEETREISRRTADGWCANYHLLRDTINDLQGDYASDYMSYRARVDACIICEDVDAEEIERLKTTIKVLSGMINE